jgi:hypothetical protein
MVLPQPCEDRTEQPGPESRYLHSWRKGVVSPLASATHRSAAYDRPELQVPDVPT